MGLCNPIIHAYIYLIFFNNTVIQWDQLAKGLGKSTARWKVSHAGLHHSRSVYCVKIYFSFKDRHTVVSIKEKIVQVNFCTWLGLISGQQSRPQIFCCVLNAPTWSSTWQTNYVPPSNSLASWPSFDLYTV